MTAFLARASTLLAVFLAPPTFLILITWNTLPGQSLYPVKRGLEEVPRLTFGKTKTAADYEVLLADRRFIEATTLIKSHNTLGLSELNTSIALAKTKAEETQNTQAEDKLVNNLLIYNQRLEEQKTTLLAAASPPTQSPNTPTPTITPPQTPTQGLPPPALSPATTPSQPPVSPPATAGPAIFPLPPRPNPELQNQETIEAIDDTQEEIKTTIKELKERKEKMRKGHQENKKQDKR